MGYTGSTLNNWTKIMLNLRITPVNSSGEVRESDTYDNTTADLNNYLMRDGCLDSEYNAGRRMQALRELCVKLAQELIDAGRRIDPLDLSLIDVQVDTIKTTRLSK